MSQGLLDPSLITIIHIILVSEEERKDGLSDRTLLHVIFFLLRLLSSSGVLYGTDHGQWKVISISLLESLSRTLPYVLIVFGMCP